MARRDNSSTVAPPVRTAGAVLEDGRLLELVRAGDNSDDLALLLARDGQVELIAREIQFCRDRFAPPELPPPFSRRLNLPASPMKAQPARGLFDGVVEILETKAGVSGREAKILACFAFATHFSDCLSECPCVAVVPAEQGEGARLLRVLATLCRHPIPLAGFWPDALWTLPASLNPTLLLCQGPRNPSAIECLQASQYNGFGWLRPSGLAENACSKIIIVNDDTPEELWQRSWAVIRLASPAGSAQGMDDNSLQQIANRFQPQFLGYRLKNYEAVRTSSFDAPQLASPIRRVARAFGACFPENPELQAVAIDALRSEDEAARAIRWLRLDSLVIEALLILCHERKQSARVAEIAELINGILEGRKEVLRVTTKKVGAVLRSFNLPLERGAKGYGFALLRDVVSQIHVFGRSLEVPSLREPFVGCEFCAAPSPTVSQ